MQNINNLIAMFIPYLLPVLGIALILYCLFKKSTEEKLKGIGVYTDGIIFEQSYQPSSVNDGFSHAPDKITVRFTTQKNESITAIAKGAFDMYYTGQYKNGDVVKVLYNQGDPSECVIITKQSENTVRIILICIGFALCITGLVLMFR